MIIKLIKNNKIINFELDDDKHKILTITKHYDHNSKSEIAKIKYIDSSKDIIIPEILFL